MNKMCITKRLKLVSKSKSGKNVTQKNYCNETVDKYHAIKLAGVRIN